MSQTHSPFLLIACLALAPVPAWADAPGSPITERLQIAGCAAEAAEYEVTLVDRILLDAAFLEGGPGPGDDELIQTTIRHQLKYVWGYYRTRLETHAAQRIVLSADEPTVVIHAKTPTLYGKDLTIGWSETGPSLQITDLYTVRAVKRGATHKDDPGLWIDYEVRFRVAMCGRARPAESTIDVPLPDDPWLLYWHVPKSEHRLMRYYDETAVTNPCSDNDFADLPHPFYYWYDWQPDRHGPDATGKEFDCRKLLHVGVDFFPHTLRLRRTAAPTPDFERLRTGLAGTGGPLLASVLIGVLDHAWTDLGYADLQKRLGSGSAAELRTRAEAILAGTSDAIGVERGTQKFLRLLSDLREVMKVEKYASSVEGAYLRADVDGHLAHSGRAIHLKTFVGLTDMFGPAPPQHWEILKKALLHDHLIVYAGHSGIGENFRLSQIEAHLNLDRAAFATEYEKAPFQLIAFLSCYSYMYFGRDLVKAADTSVGKEFVYTGTEFTKGDRGALSMLDFLDGVLAPHTTGKGGRTRRRLRYVEPADFLLFKGRW